MDRKERYYMSSVRLGPKGQIVIPKEARDLFRKAQHGGHSPLNAFGV